MSKRPDIGSWPRRTVTNLARWLYYVGHGPGRCSWSQLPQFIKNYHVEAAARLLNAGVSPSLIGPANLRWR